jgi:hypothetical protein
MLFMLVLVVKEALDVELGKCIERFFETGSNHDNCSNFYQAMKIG